MTEISKIEAQQLVVEPFHVDFTGRLTYGILGNHLLNVAGVHAARRGFGMGLLHSRHYAWVLSRLTIEMEEMPREGIPFTVQTWVEDVYRLFTNRNFSVLGADGHAYGYARSIWAMIDIDNRKPVDLTALYGDDIARYFTQQPCPIPKPSHIKPLEAAATPAATFPVRYGDIDINEHVNSIRYIEHVLDLFPLERYARQRVKRFEIAYVAEARYGDELACYVDASEDPVFTVEVRSRSAQPGAEEATACRAKIFFE